MPVCSGRNRGPGIKGGIQRPDRKAAQPGIPIQVPVPIPGWAQHHVQWGVLSPSQLQGSDGRHCAHAEYPKIWYPSKLISRTFRLCLLLSYCLCLLLSYCLSVSVVAPPPPPPPIPSVSHASPRYDVQWAKILLLLLLHSGCSVGKYFNTQFVCYTYRHSSSCTSRSFSIHLAHSAPAVLDCNSSWHQLFLCVTERTVTIF